MLGTGKQINAFVFEWLHILHACRDTFDSRMHERSRAAPVFVRRIRVEDLRHVFGSDAGQKSVRRAAAKLQLRRVDIGTMRTFAFVLFPVAVRLHAARERKHHARIEKAPARARRLREAVVEAAPRAAGDVRYRAVENLALRFIRIESVVEEGSNQPPALRGAEYDRPFERFGADAELRSAVVLERRDGVADGREPESRDARVFGHVDHLVDPVRVEAAAQVHHAGIGYHAVSFEPAETPLCALDRLSLVHGRVAHGHDVRCICRIGDGVRRMTTVAERLAGHALADDEVAAYEAVHRCAAGAG